MKKILVAYFSASGETARLAKTIADVIGGDLFEILPEAPYTAADLDWKDKTSRSTLEMKDAASRPAISGRVENMAQYDTVLWASPSGGIRLRASSRPSLSAMTLQARR